MKRRIVTGIVAVLLACVGVAVLLRYAHGADTRALAGVQTVDVLVVSTTIPKGTPVTKLAKFVRVQAVPANLAVPGSMSDLDPIAGRVATIALQPGEQLLSSRFDTSASLEPAGQVSLPAGMQEITLSLEPQRAVGGTLVAGDTVGVFLSAKGNSSATNTTHLTLQKVLVTRVDAGNSDSSASASGSDVLVTLALLAPAAEELVFGAEHGTVWLSDEPATASETGTRPVTGTGIAK